MAGKTSSRPTTPCTCGGASSPAPTCSTLPIQGTTATAGRFGFPAYEYIWIFSMVQSDITFAPVRDQRFALDCMGGLGAARRLPGSYGRLSRTGLQLASIAGSGVLGDLECSQNRGRRL